jgi:hypothetical protein
MLRALALRNLAVSTAAHHAKAPAKRSSLIATAVTRSVRETFDLKLSPQKGAKDTKEIRAHGQYFF